MNTVKLVCVILLLSAACINSVVYCTTTEKTNSLAVIISFILLIIIISIIPVSFIFKTLLLTIPIYIYYRNICLTANLIYICYKWNIKHPATSRINDVGLRNDILHTYKQYFTIIDNFKYIPLRPTIFVANYCIDRIENVLCMSIPVKLSVVMRDIFKNPLTIFGNSITSPIYIEENRSYDYLHEQIKNHHEQCRYIFVYVTKGHYNSYSNKTIGKVSTGIFNIAKSLNISVTPICMDRVEYDNVGRLKYQNFEIHVGKEMQITNIQSDILAVKKFFKQTLHRFEQQKYINIYN